MSPNERIMIAVIISQGFALKRKIGVASDFRKQCAIAFIIVRSILINSEIRGKMK